MEDFDKVLRSGVMYPRWLPNLNKGYGSAWPNFESPVLSSWINSSAFEMTAP